MGPAMRGSGTIGLHSSLKTGLFWPFPASQPSVLILNYVPGFTFQEIFGVCLSRNSFVSHFIGVFCAWYLQCLKKNYSYETAFLLQFSIPFHHPQHLSIWSSPLLCQSCIHHFLHATFYGWQLYFDWFPFKLSYIVYVQCLSILIECIYI